MNLYLKVYRIFLVGFRSISLVTFNQKLKQNRIFYKKHDIKEKLRKMKLEVPVLVTGVSQFRYRTKMNRHELHYQFHYQSVQILFQ